MLKASDIEKMALVNLFLRECVFRLLSTNIFIDYFSQNKDRYVSPISINLYRFIAIRVKPIKRPIRMNRKIPKSKLNFILSKDKGIV